MYLDIRDLFYGKENAPVIVGGRYGSEASSSKDKPTRSFFDRYDSITKKEYENAVGRDIPIYILIENNVYSEYQTYLSNKDNSLYEAACFERSS